MVPPGAIDNHDGFLREGCNPIGCDSNIFIVVVAHSLHLFPDGAHNIHHKFADEFNAIVSDFLTAPAAVASS